ncbi:MAG: efflux RND transporter periplasmic adaptor subunit [Planctomycetaceae bacterium]|nr:efflux RND transporter periplasmic adaptor subunit [Planctomycetaceae bacterium]
MKHAVRRMVLVVVILAVAVAAVTGYVHWRTADESRSHLVLYGNVDIRQVELAFNANERIEKVFVVEGQKVEAGQLLAELTTNRLAPAAQSGAAQVASQKAVVARLLAGSRPEEIAKAKADAAAAEADVRNADLQYRNTLKAYTSGAATQQEMDNARAARDASHARLDSANQTLKLAVEGPRKEDIQAAQATLGSLEANLVLLRQQLADARLYAPSNGIIRNRILEPGDMASPAKPALTLAVTDPLWVRAYVNENDLGKIHPGMSAVVTTDSFPGKKYGGWVGFISPTAEFTPKQVQTPELRTALVYEVRIYVHNPDGQLRLGMPATVTIAMNQPAATRPAAASLPASAAGGASP